MVNVFAAVVDLGASIIFVLSLNKIGEGIMRHIAFLLMFVFSVLNTIGQPVPKKEKKYQGLLWEISGNGLAKPSYLFGTMHVSNKLAFHLADSFFYAIKSVNVVALETNPANWQEEYSKPNIFDQGSYGNAEDNPYKLTDIPNDYLHKNSFEIKTYENDIKLALATEPAMINGMLYRTYNYRADFEEDTYLDMYIFQTGSKLGKKLTGVEDFEQSEKLVAEAFKDAAKEKSAKNYEKDYSYEDYVRNPYTIEDAYRKGDLDLLDSLEMKQFNSKAFLEKFLFKRNEIQANSIDSIIKSNTSLFAGVGCAHLPGKRGVIELLRNMGYKLRPVKMGKRDGKQKDFIDKVRVPVSFKKVVSDDGVFSVEIPGEKFYSFSRFGGLNTRQFADMGNGAYYVVSRIKTNSLFLGDTEEEVYKKVDSLLYENIPGKILKKSALINNGFRGFDITNKTRRGDIQRHNIFITPFEIIFFKISGIGEYVAEGKEANHYFNSIKIEKSSNEIWKTFTPVTGGFQLLFPHEPQLQKDNGSNRLEFTAVDKKEKASFLLMKANIHNYNFIEEDTFDLNLMEESFASSKHIEKQLHRKFSKWQGYPTLDCKYKNKDGYYTSARFLLKGGIYYAQVARYAKETNTINRFFESFKIVPFNYPGVKQYTDTGMHFTVQSPLFTEDNKQKELMKTLRSAMEGYGDDETDENNPELKIKIIGNDTAGEKIVVAYAKVSKNTFIKDSSKIFDYDTYDNGIEGNKKQSFVYLNKDSGITSGGFQYKLQQVTDTNSSRTLISKSFYKAGNFFTLVTLTDTLSPRSSLLYSFIESFKPDETVAGESPFVKRNAEFFKDFLSKDSVIHTKALKRLRQIEFDAADIPVIKNIIDTLSWQTKDYLEIKQTFISGLGNTKDTSLVDYLKQLYINVTDTADFQNIVLKTLLQLQTKNSFEAFKDLIINEPPAITQGYDYSNYNDIIYNVGKLAQALDKSRINYKSHRGFWGQLYDTLNLAKTIFPDILQLINLDDYKGDVMELLTTMVDSGFVEAKVYESYFSKIYVEAKQELKKEKASINQKAILKAEKANKAEKAEEVYFSDRNNPNDMANVLLESYAVLLLPFWDKNPGIPLFFSDLLKINNKRIRFNTMMLLLRNRKQVPDTLLNIFAVDDNYRIELYRKLKKAGMVSKFPAMHLNQLSLVKSALLNFSENKMDTMVLLEKIPITVKNKSGFVYFYKYKSNKGEKNWKLVSYGMQPVDSKEFDDENIDFVSTNSYGYGIDSYEKLDETKPVNEQFQKMIKKLIYKMHKSADEFYNNRFDDEDKAYMAERIKTNRFGD